MALHRDIFWVGRQWAVTGHGVQAVDQKQKSKFDIEASRLWEDDLLVVLSDQRWFNEEDFLAALSVARAKYPAAPGTAAARKKSAEESARAPVAPSKVTAKSEAKAESKIEPWKTEPLEPAMPDTKAKASKAPVAVVPAKPEPKPEPSKTPAAPAASKLAITSGPSQPTFTVKSRARKNRPAAQISMGAVGWPAKFTRMWRIRVNPR
jgi:hypothetical protein